MKELISSLTVTSEAIINFSSFFLAHKRLSSYGELLTAIDAKMFFKSHRNR